ncbi:hypothetical protein C1H46_007955 [Malus baccata]|uniref:Uncharacterized protein n=1 Tax=Malus baccata TaxID=106549 RepID=A0A540N5Z7_MALBA|nr:hypothetical protein C1H46_007955 [Malus baccata]
MGAATCIDIILAIILPPLGVFLRFGFGILDLFGADSVWLPPWYYICHLCHHQVILSICVSTNFSKSIFIDHRRNIIRRLLLYNYL